MNSNQNYLNTITTTYSFQFMRKGIVYKTVQFFIYTCQVVITSKLIITIHFRGQTFKETQTFLLPFWAEAKL